MTEQDILVFKEEMCNKFKDFSEILKKGTVFET
jgi:hypothetical protein